jgi:hypothetical protein
MFRIHNFDVIIVNRLLIFITVFYSGLILFVDEADAFLRKRSSETISEDLRYSSVDTKWRKYLKTVLRNAKTSNIFSKAETLFDTVFWR